MSIIAAFFKTNTKIDSDEARQNFARLALENSKFLYSNSDGDGPEVCMMTMIYCTIFANIFIQGYKGFLRGPFVIQTFSAHFDAVRGSIKVDGLGSPDANNTRPIGALGLAAAAVSGMIAACIYY
jgi:hypothetical protein